MKYVLIGIGVLILFVGVVVAGSYVSAYNTGNKLENQIVATYENNEQILGQYGQKVQEAAQVPAMQRDDLTKVVTAALAGRYGENGSQAVFQWIQEQNPQIDSTVYVKLQQIIEAGRNEFQVAQTMLVDQKRTYRTALGSFWQGTWLSIANYPNINIGFRGGVDDYPAITTSRASDAFEKGREDSPIQLVPSK